MKKWTRIVLFAVLLAGSQTTYAATAEEFLRADSAPIFKSGHSLKPLSRWGWNLGYEATVELAERWGYALEFGGTSSKAAESARNLATKQGKLCQLVNSNPELYHLSVSANRQLLNDDYVASLPESFWLHDKNGNRLDAPEWKLRSPEAPDSIFEDVARRTVTPMEDINSHCPISVILDGGEHGMHELGHTYEYIIQDPAVIAGKGSDSWYDYYSKQKARMLMPTRTAIKKAVPNRDVSIWYHTTFSPRLVKLDWGWKYEYLREVSDFPNQRLYYLNGGFNTGWTGAKDLLTRYLATYAHTAEYGDKFSYNWLSGGWEDGSFSDYDRYMGFIKSLYMGGQIGAVAGYFTRPEGGFEVDLGDEIPQWLAQMMVLGHAHALFSHLEDFIFDGELLEGPVAKAYEFPTGDDEARVLVRKRNGVDEWLVSAWAAGGGARNVTVTVPGLGELVLLARPAGSIYRVTLTEQGVQKELVDVDAMHPTNPSSSPDRNTDPITINPGLNDAWYSVATDGQGFYISVFPEIGYVSLAWFTYDTVRPDDDVTANLGESGHRWLTALGRYSGSQSVMDVSFATGGRFDAPFPVTELSDGTIILTFSDCNHATVEYDIPSIGQSGTVPIERIVGDNFALCETLSDQAGMQQGSSGQEKEQISTLLSDDPVSTVEVAKLVTMNAGLNDAWYNAATDGQGFYISVFPEIGYVSLAWFTYDTVRPDGNVTANLGEPGHRWLNAVGQFSGTRSVMDVSFGKGGRFDSPAEVTEVNDGTIILNFVDCNHATVDYDIPSIGRSRKVPIKRVVGDNIALCESLSSFIGTEGLQIF